MSVWISTTYVRNSIDTDKHLTNVAININSPNYVKKIGGKWFLNDIKLFMMSKFGIDRTNQAFTGIQKAIIKSLIAVQKLVANDKRSFELYGYDFLFDAKMKAWLLEVNGGPSMSANTEADSELKVGLVDDVMTTLDLEKM
jgi:tubulin polyglutamylase TTLL9